MSAACPLATSVRVAFESIEHPSKARLTEAPRPFAMLERVTRVIPVAPLNIPSASAARPLAAPSMCTLAGEVAMAPSNIPLKATPSRSKRALPTPPERSTARVSPASLSPEHPANILMAETTPDVSMKRADAPDP